MNPDEGGSVTEPAAMKLIRGADDWEPTPHGKTLGEALARRNFVAGKRVLELGGGVGNHTIVMARQGPQTLVTTEVAARLLETTRINVQANVPGASRFVEYRVADWLDTAGTFDLIVANPPFAKSGQRNRRFFIDSLILGAHKRLTPNGELIFVQSSMADIAKTGRRLTENGYEFEIVHEVEGPFRDYYFEDPSFMEEIQAVPNGFDVRDGVYYERLFVVHGRLKEWPPPDGAHVI